MFRVRLRRYCLLYFIGLFFEVRDKKFYDFYVRSIFVFFEDGGVFYFIK